MCHNGMLTGLSDTLHTLPRAAKVKRGLNSHEVARAAGSRGQLIRGAVAVPLRLEQVCAGLHRMGDGSAIGLRGAGACCSGRRGAKNSSALSQPLSKLCRLCPPGLTEEDSRYLRTWWEGRGGGGRGGAGGGEGE